MTTRSDKRWPLWVELLIILMAIYLSVALDMRDWKWPTQIHRLRKENRTVSKPCISDSTNDSLKKSNEFLQKEIHRLKNLPPPKPVTITIKDTIKGDCNVKIVPVVLAVKKKVLHRKHRHHGNGRGIYGAHPICGCPRPVGYPDN